MNPQLSSVVEQSAVARYVPSSNLGVGTTTPQKILTLVKFAFKNCTDIVSIDFQGSYRKQTNIDGISDLDIFIVYKTRSLSQIIKSYVKNMTSFFLKKDLRSVYSGHPYFQLFFENLIIDVVPVSLFLPGQKLITPMDRTPEHTKYVLSKISPKTREEIILLKKFLKKYHLYSGPTMNSGFHGYLCECLIFHFGSFKKFLLFSRDICLSAPVVITGNPSSFSEYFVFEDPIDPARNLSACVSYHCVCLLKFYSTQFLLGIAPIFELSFEKSICISPDLPISSIGSYAESIISKLKKFININYPGSFLWIRYRIDNNKICYFYHIFPKSEHSFYQFPNIPGERLEMFIKKRKEFIPLFFNNQLYIVYFKSKKAPIDSFIRDFIHLKEVKNNKKD